MSKQVQIGSDIYIIPEAGENPGWGEDLTEFFEALAAALTDVQGPNDILLTSATLANNQVAASNISGLLFNVADVQGVEVDYFIIRIYDSGASTTTERGKILGAYDGSVFSISTEAIGDSGVTISVTNAGQFQYISDNKPNHVSSIVRYKGRTIDQP